VTLSGNRTVRAQFDARRKKATTYRAHISSARIDRRRHSARLSFRISPSGRSAVCALVRRRARGAKAPKPQYRTCRSPRRFSHLKAGYYTFTVRPRGSGASARASRTFTMR
jgi:hypothetical protein